MDERNRKSNNNLKLMEKILENKVKMDIRKLDLSKNADEIDKEPRSILQRTKSFRDRANAIELKRIRKVIDKWVGFKKPTEPTSNEIDPDFQM